MKEAEWRRTWLSFVAGVAILSGCASPSLSEKQRALLQSRLFPKAKIDAVFNHLKSSLSQDRFSIKSADSSQGTIVASRSLPNQGGSSERREEIIINLAQSSEGVKATVSIQWIAHYSLGGIHGREILERAPYEQFFARADKAREDDRIPASVRIGK